MLLYLIYQKPAVFHKKVQVYVKIKTKLKPQKIPLYKHSHSKKMLKPKINTIKIK